MKIHLQNELDRLKQRLFHLSAMVEENLTMGVEAVLAGDAAAGERVRQRDADIDRLEVEVEEECLKILALHQPVAIDLRLLIAILKMNNDLERISDLAVSIASGSACRAGEAMPEELGARMQELANKGRAMLRKTLESLMAMDVRVAREVLAADDEVDALYFKFSGVIKTMLATNPEDKGWLISWLMAAKCLERVGDHATNIAEDTIYSVEGEIVRHRKV